MPWRIGGRALITLALGTIIVNDEGFTIMKQHDPGIADQIVREHNILERLRAVLPNKPFGAEDLLWEVLREIELME